MSEETGARELILDEQFVSLLENGVLGLQGELVLVRLRSVNLLDGRGRGQSLHADVLNEFPEQQNSRP